MNKNNTELLAAALHDLIFPANNFYSRSFDYRKDWLLKTEKVKDVLEDIIYEHHEDMFGGNE